MTYIRNKRPVVRRAAMIAALVLATATRAGAQGGELVAAYRATLPTTPDDTVWSAAASTAVPLLPQDMVEPRLGEPSTRELHVQAFTDVDRIVFRLQWADDGDQDVHGVSSFTDACAVQLPRAAGADLPAPQMGESGKAVEMTYWRASWQAMVDGREDSVRALHPGAAVDHYPFEAPSLEKGSDEQLAMEQRYAPARKLENPMAGPRTQPVQDLVAEGPGTIRPAPASLSTGRGKYSNGGWAVVLARPLPDGLAASKRTQAAFAVWQGSHGESGARKMRSVWMPLRLEAKP